MNKMPLVFPLLLILLSSTITPYSFASVESEAQEDVMAGCRDGQTMVYRLTYHDFICVEPSTANRWVELGMAEIILESSDSETEFSEIEDVEADQFPGAPPPAPKPTVTDSSDNSACRDGNILVYHFAYQDTICTSFSTASTWDRLGIVEIIKDTIPAQDDTTIEITVDPSSENIVATTETSDKEEQETVMEEEQETVMEEEQETVMENESEALIDDTPKVVFDSDEYPIILEVEDNVFKLIDHDGSTSFLIEGDEGIVLINSLSSYQSTKKITDEFQKISDKKIKAVVLTNISPEIIFALEAYAENSDGLVDIVISEDLLQYFEDNNSKVKNTIPFSGSLSVDIAGLNLELFTTDRGDSFQTLIYLPDYAGMIIGDSEYGLYPILFDVEPFSRFLNEESNMESELESDLDSENDL